MKNIFVFCHRSDIISQNNKNGFPQTSKLWCGSHSGFSVFSRFRELYFMKHLKEQYSDQKPQKNPDWTLGQFMRSCSWGAGTSRSETLPQTWSIQCRFWEQQWDLGFCWLLPWDAKGVGCSISRWDGPGWIMSRWSWTDFLFPLTCFTPSHMLTFGSASEVDVLSVPNTLNQSFPFTGPHTSAGAWTAPLSWP